MDEAEARAAADRFLTSTARPEGTEPDWAETKAGMESELAERIDPSTLS